MDDIFRSFFGFRGGRNGRGFPEHPGFQDESGNHDDYDDEIPANRGNDGFHFHSPDGAFTFSLHFPDPGELVQQFDEMFRNIGISEIPSLPPGQPQLPEKPASPRDEMLKKPEHDTPPMFGQPWELPPWSRSRPNIRQDSDLDKEVEEKGIDSFLSEKPSRLERVPAPHPHPGTSYHRSVSVRRIQGPDGRVEEHRTVNDGSGRETTVRRIIGDKSHSVTTKTDKDGKQETVENFSNLDEKELGTFEEEWHSNSGRKPDPRNELVLDGDPVDSQTQSIFKNIFGFSFPGFRKS